MIKSFASCTTCLFIENLSKNSFFFYRRTRRFWLALSIISQKRVQRYALFLILANVFKRKLKKMRFLCNYIDYYQSTWKLIPYYIIYRALIGDMRTGGGEKS